MEFDAITLMVDEGLTGSSLVGVVRETPKFIAAAATNAESGVTQ